MNETASTILLADIGGTYARFALANDSGYDSLLEVQCADFANVGLAIDFYAQQHDVTFIRGVCIAAAGPKVEQQIRLTNNHWIADGPSLSEHLGGVRVQLLNDFEAVAWSLPQLGPDHITAIGELAVTPPEPDLLPANDFNALIIGAGTGLGVAGLMRRGGVMHAIVGEGGHLGFAAENRQQMAILANLQERYDRVIVEHLVSGPGLVNVYSALKQMADREGSQSHSDYPGPAQIFELAQSGEDEIAEQTVDLFFRVLGQVAGDLVLAMGAFNGVFIAGGIARRHSQRLQASEFRKAFESKGPYRELMQRVPTNLVLHPHPGLLGARYCFLQSEGLEPR